MNPGKRGQETTRLSKLPIRKKARTEGGSSTNVSPLPFGQVYSPVPLRTARTVDLGNGNHGTLVHSTSNNSFTFLQPEVSLAAPAAPNPIMQLFPLAPAAPPAAPAPQNGYEVEEEKRGILLIKLLHSCATAVAEGDAEVVNKGLQLISIRASEDGEEPMQRLAYSFADALALRLRMVQPRLQHGIAITAPAQEAAAARRHFAAMCPFLRIAGAVANHAIIDAVAAQPGMIIHVVDLGGVDPDQWLQLLRLLAPRSSNLLLRVTIVNEQEEFLSDAATLLHAEAKRLGVGFRFHAVRLHIDQLISVDALGITSGEALFVVSTLQLHRLLANEFAEVASLPRDRKGKQVLEHGAQQRTMPTAEALLRDLRELSPKLLLVTEQEADHNSADFMGRFRNALTYYGNLFDALEESVPARGSVAERACVERSLLREEITDIVARDGALRRERHEKLESWEARMVTAGFAPAAVRQVALAQAETLAQELVPGGAYRVSRANDGRVFIYRNAIPMFAVSTWRVV